jgi:hypothetical protein
MNSESRQISVLDPISPAIERIKLMLFRPFDWGKWFAVGFCAWLALLSKGGGGGFNFRAPFDGRGSGCNSVNNVRDVFPANAILAVFIVFLIVAVGICIWAVLLWLSSRGKFMFLNCVARNSKQIKVPWSRYGSQANSLFWFRFLVSLIPVATILGLVLAIFFWCTSIAAAGSDFYKVFSVFGIAWLVFLGIAVVIILLIIMKLTEDFVVPVMYIHELRCMEAWRRFRSILSVNKGKFTLYILFQIVIGMAISTIVIAAILVTCCCAACIFVIPYIGTVAMLPLSVFRRAYSAYYLQQYGDEFDVFAEAEPEGDIPILNTGDEVEN